jgi:hypothetical protein
MPDTKLDQYKSYLLDMGGVGTRYSTANGFYLSVLTALVGILALTEGSKPLGQMRPGVVVGIPLVAISICWIWYRTISFYSKLFAIKLAVLRTLEADLSAQPFEEELKASANLEPLTKNERRVPVVIGLLFGAVAVAAVLFRVLGTP